MVTNPYRELYKGLMWTNPPNVHELAVLSVDLYYALDEALGRIYELEQTLEGLLDAAHDHKEVVKQ